MDFWRIFGVVLHGSQILDARYWMLDHAPEIVAFIQYQVTSIQHQCADSDPFHGRHTLLSSKNFILRTIASLAMAGRSLAMAGRQEPASSIQHPVSFS